MINHPTTISAILPNYNHADLLPGAIQSLIAQSEPLTEIIIVDDGSTDHSLHVIHSFMHQHQNIRLIKHSSNKGVSEALNTGIKHAIGEYVMLCAADDRYSEKMAACGKEGMLLYPEVGIICGDAIVHRFDMKKKFKRTLPYLKKRTWIPPAEFRALAKHQYVGFNSGGSMLMKRSAVIEAGMLYPATRWHNDWLLYFTIAMMHGIYYVDEIFIEINMRKESYSENKKQRAIQKEVMLSTIHILHNHPLPLWCAFKEGALLPHYSLYDIPLFLRDPIARQYITWRLIWRCFINNHFIVRLGRLFPYWIILRARQLLRA